MFMHGAIPHCADTIRCAAASIIHNQWISSCKGHTESQDWLLTPRLYDGSVCFATSFLYHSGKLQQVQDAESHMCK